MPLVEEVEQALKCSIGNVEFGVLLFYLVHIEHAPIQIRYATIDSFKLMIMFGSIESIMEEIDQKAFIELIKETVLAFLLACPLQFVAQIIWIAIQEAFLLNEVTEHQAVEHHRCVPLFVLVLLIINMVVNAGNKFCKVAVLFLKPGIEVLGNFLRIDEESRLHFFYDVENRRIVFERERKTLHFLEQESGLVKCVVFHQHHIALLHFLYGCYP